MTGPARPLRFVALTLLLWTAARAVFLWPVGAPEAPPVHLAAAQAVAPASPAVTPGISVALTTAFERRPAIVPPLHALAAESPVPEVRTAPAHAPAPSAPPPAPAAPYRALLAFAVAEGPGLVPLARPPPARDAHRLSGYGWAFVRAPNGGSGLAQSGQLGGSQAGMRLDYAIGPDPARGLRLSARVSAPLEGKGHEAAIGIGWKPGGDIPVTLTVERRIGLDRAGRDAFAAGVAGGIGAVPLPADFRLDAYGQAGVVGMKRRDAYVDGAASALRPVLARKTVSVSAGAGLWGAAQPGVSRLDIGPRLRVAIDLGGASIGAAIDWRQRIAGHASPRSGLAVTLDGSF